ncbi:MAG TPA: hypothetical protein PLN48_11100 [Lachnospiraceae bacterium]|nr:hypothetical protein [Lachnospiraceae bacterium]
MRSRILRVLILIAVFCGGVFLFTHLMNSQVTESTSDLSDPTLPVMCVNSGSNRIDEMFGYQTEMAAADMRDTLIPMTTDRTLTVSYEAKNNKVKSVSYEVTAPDTGEVIENAKIGNFKTDGDYRTAAFSLTEPILMNREYPIKFTITTADRDIYYYARLIQRADLLTDKYVQFVYDFYETCTNKAGAGDLNNYLETDATVTNTSFTNVNLKSSLDQVTWGSLSPQIYRKAVPAIREINSETCSITTDYLISASSSSGTTEIYHVWEFYRLRYYNDKMMLLNFNRKAIQVFNGSDSASITTDGIFLGVTTKSITYKTNQGSDIIAFIEDGALWEFNESAEKLSCVFTFHSTADGSDERDDHSDYDIKIIRVSEGGDIDFAVYGYMNRGSHEGHAGVYIGHYNSESSTVEERTFIPYPKSYQYLANDLSRLCYVNTEGIIYIYLNRSVYKIDPASGTNGTVLTDINPDCFVSSNSQSEIAWENEMQKNASENLTVMNLETGETRSVAAGADQYIKAIGFINDDFIYGCANKADIQNQPAGDVVFAMKELKIESFDGTLVKDYNPDNIWVSDVTIKEGLVELTRVTKDGEGGGYVAAPTDNIMNNMQTAESKVTIGVGVTTRQGTVITLKMPKTVSNLKPLVTNFKLKTTSGNSLADLGITTADDYTLYYVYAYGSLQAVLTDAEKAIVLADADVGVVVNQQGQYIYERGVKDTEKELRNEDIPAAFLSGEINADKLQAAVGDSATVMNLSGCTLDQVLYEVSNGRAVVTRLANGDITVIVGYNRYNTLLYDFTNGSHYYMGINDSKAAFEAGGNVYVSYVEPQTTVKKD